MAKLRILFVCTILLFVGIFISTDKTYVLAAKDEEITKGVYIDSIHIGGMTVSEAKATVEEYVNNLRSKTITVSFDENKESITLGDLDYTYTKNTFIEDSLEIGRHGNLIKRYKELKDIEEANLIYQLEFTINEEKLNQFIEEKLSQYSIPATNATVSREQGKFIYTDHKTGRKLMDEETIKTIKDSIMEGWNQDNIELAATVVDDEPLYTRELVEKCNTLLGTFSTTYASSSSDRAGNLANGARLINNTVLYPGDVFSAYEKMTPFTVSNGYFEAGAYENGRVVDSIGGGACQVTTTLYNAVLLAELEIVERAAHSMTISYVDLSKDAAIAGTWKDLKFKNNKDVPVIVEVYTQGRTITFNIWGHEERDIKNRKIVFETVVLDEKQPGPDVVTKDPTKPTTYRVTTQSAHIGYTTELYKVIYENGVEVSRTRVNKSVYNASPRYVTEGTMEVEEPVEEPVEEKPTTEVPSSPEETPEGSGDDTSGSDADSGGYTEELEDDVLEIDDNEDD